MSDTWQKLEDENIWGYLKRLRFVQRAIAEAFPGRPASSIRVLDVGCGNGSQLALSLVEDGFALTGVDPDLDSIEHARRLAVGKANARFLCLTVDALDKTEVFDVVILSEVLEHVSDPGALLKSGLQRISTDGIVIVTVPNGYGEFELDWWLFRALHLQSIVDVLASAPKDIVGSTDNQEAGHIQFFTRSRLRQLFDECHLKVFLEGASSLFSGPIIGHIFGRFEKFIEWNARAADSVPHVFSSGWFFALRLEKD